MIIGDCDGEASGQEREGVHPPIKGNYIIGSKNLLTPKKGRIFGPETAKYAPKSASLVSVDQKVGLSSLFTAILDQKKKEQKLSHSIQIP